MRGMNGMRWLVKILDNSGICSLRQERGEATTRYEEKQCEML